MPISVDIIHQGKKKVFKRISMKHGQPLNSAARRCENELASHGLGLGETVLVAAVFGGTIHNPQENIGLTICIHVSQ